VKSLAIVQARMASTRLPSKVLRTVLGKPLLEYQIERLARAKTLDGIVVATTEGDGDDPIVALCRRLGVPCHRGPEDDVLARYHGAAKAYGADPVARVTADCPLIDPEVVDRIVARYREGEGACDYVSNTLRRTYPRGLDVEVFSFGALAAAHREATLPSDREHVTAFLYRRPERFRLVNVESGEDLGHHRWTVDTPEDFRLIAIVLESLYPSNPGFGMRDVLALLEADPSLERINAHVEQKPLNG
jgi:spore coat polysaccharide biosynthesis protein SpsF